MSNGNGNSGPNIDFEDVARTAKTAADVYNTATANGGGGGGGGGGAQRGQTGGGSSGGSSGQRTRVTQVALDMELGLRKPGSGDPTQKGKSMGLQPVDQSLAQKATRLYRQQQGGGGGGGAVPQGPPSGPPSGGGGGGAVPQPGQSKYPSAPRPSAHLPANFESDLPSNLIRWVSALAKWAVDSFGTGGALEIWETLGNLMGKRVPDNALSPAEVDAIVDDLPKEMRQAITRWQAGFDDPMTNDSKVQEYFLLLKVATSGYDMDSREKLVCVPENSYRIQ